MCFSFFYYLYRQQFSFIFHLFYIAFQGTFNLALTKISKINFTAHVCMFFKNDNPQFGIEVYFLKGWIG